MKSSLQTFKKRISRPNVESSDGLDYANFPISASNDALEATTNVRLDDSPEVATTTKSEGKGILKRKRQGRKKAYETATDTDDAIENADELGSHNEPAKPKNRPSKEKRFSFFRRSVHAFRLSAIDDPQASPEQQKSSLSRPKSTDLTRAPAFSILSLMRRSMRRSRQKENNMCVVAIETSPCDAEILQQNFPSCAVENTQCSSDVSNAKVGTIKTGSEEMTAMSTSTGSNENHSNRDVSTKDSFMDTDLGLDMTDIVVNVSRLDNKAAYDKIALRPKRRPARNARGTRQQHVVRVQPHQINGLTEVDSPSVDDKKDDKAATTDTSPPMAKKARAPILSVPLQQDSGDRNSGEKSSPTPKRFSMLRSPMGPGPGMMVPTLQDVQNFKLRKSQGDKSKELPEKTPEKQKGGESKAAQEKPEKATKSKPPKKAVGNKKTSKQDKKTHSEGGSSIFPWRNKSSSPKSPVPGPKAVVDRSKENETHKGFFPGLKQAKKSGQEKGSKAPSRFLSSSEKKETSKKGGFRLGKRDKSGVKTAPENTVDFVEEKSAMLPPISPTPQKSDEPCSQKVEICKEPPSSQEVEAPGETFPNVFETGVDDESAEKSLLEQISEELSQKQQPQNVSRKRQSSGSKYAAKLKLEADSLAENRVNYPRSPEPIIDKEKLNSDSDKAAAVANTTVYHEADDVAVSSESVSDTRAKPGSPSSPEKTRPFSFKKAGDVKIGILKPTNSPLEQSPTNASPVSDQLDHSINFTKDSDQEKTELPPSSVSTFATTEPNRTGSPDKREDESIEVVPCSLKTDGTLHAQSSVQMEEEKSEMSVAANAKQETSPMVEIPISTSPVSEKKLAVKPTPEAAIKKDFEVVPDKANVDQQQSAQSRKEESEFLKSNEKAEKSKLDSKDSALQRYRSSDANIKGNESPAEPYSKTKLKFTGDRRPNRRATSVKTPPGSTPTKALRPHSFNVKPAASKSTNSPVSLSTEPRTPMEKSLREASPSLKSPSSIEETPTVDVRNKSPSKPSLRTTKNEISLQDAVNNNVRLSESSKDSEKKSTLGVDQPATVQRTGREEKSGDELPAWVQMARRRSKVWEDDPYKPQRTPSHRSRAATDPTEDDSHHKTLTVTPTKKTSTTDPAPVKTTTPTASSNARFSRTASIPTIGLAPTRKTSPAAKGAAESATNGKPSWLAIAVQKQKNWAK